jgi:LAS superfamily LD-carboxypeptidase LdcB
VTDSGRFHYIPVSESAAPAGECQLRATRRHPRPVRALLVSAIAAAGLVLGPTPPPTQALPAQEEPTLPNAGDVAVDGDVFKADDGDVVDALNNLHGNLRTQLRELDAARSRVAAARDEKAKADQAVAATQKRIDDLTAQSDGVVIDAFVNTPADSALDAMAAESTGDASLKASIVGMQHDADASVLARLRDAHDDLDARKAAQGDAARRAAAAADDAAGALEDLEAAQSQEAALVLEVQARLDQNLSEAEALAGIDPALAARLKAQESDIASRLEAIRTAEEQRRALEALRKAQAEAAARRAAEARAVQAAARPGAFGPATGSLSNVACPGGGSITVDSSLASNLSSLLRAASAAGLNMCGGGYRDPAQQVALRRAHCGSSNYAIYEAPSSACSPPTARPGTSMHEKGLAIDFTCGGGTVLGGTACFSWLEGHAGAYGLSNLPSEPWHWSTNGQ